MDERLSHQCHSTGCDTQAEFTTRFVVDCVAPGVRIPVRANCTIKVCLRHRSEELVRNYIMSPQNRETITVSLLDAGHGEPDWFSAKVFFDPISQDIRNVLANPPPPVIRCDRDGCRKVAKWQIYQAFRMIWQRGRGPHEIKVLTNLCVCDEHKALTTPAAFKDRESESSTRAWLNAIGVSMPDFKTMQVGFAPITDTRLDPKEWVGDDGPVSQFQKKGGPAAVDPLRK